MLSSAILEMYEKYFKMCFIIFYSFLDGRFICYKFI